MKILVADAHPVTRLGLRQLLGMYWPQAEIEEAETIASALRLLAESRPDLILLEPLMPDAVGVDGAARVLRSARGAPVLVLSLGAERTYAGRLLQMGAQGYAPKTLGVAELARAIAKVHAGGRFVTDEVTDQLVALLSGETPAALPHESLSMQELRVLQFIAAGRTPLQIAQAMNISSKTVGGYRQRLMHKGGWHSTAEISKYCLQHGLTDPS